MRMFAPERLDAIRDQLTKRINMIHRVRDGKTSRTIESVHNMPNLSEPNPGIDLDWSQGMNGPDFGI